MKHNTYNNSCFNDDKPKNFSRFCFICSHDCVISSYEGSFGKDVIHELLKFKVSYEVQGNNNDISPLRHRGSYKIKYKYWGKFIKLIDYPSILDELNDEDYILNISHFKRDRVLMPFVMNIQIINIEKFNIIKLKLDRKNKLKLINLENYG